MHALAAHPAVPFGTKHEEPHAPQFAGSVRNLVSQPVAGVRVVTARNPVHAVLWLVLAFFTAAAHWLMLGAEFLAIVLVLVYVGAVMVLFLFVVMMLDVNFDSLRKNFRSYIPVGATVDDAARSVAATRPAFRRRRPAWCGYRTRCWRCRQSRN